MMALAETLHRSSLLSHLDLTTLAHLLDSAVQISGDAGAPVHAGSADALVVVKGGVEVRDREGGLLATVRADGGQHQLGILHTVPNGARISLIEPSELLVVEGAVLDDALSQKHQMESVGSLEGKLYERVSALVHAKPFSDMTLDQICRSADAMEDIAAQAGDEIIRYADRGDRFYVVASGEAEVWRPDMRSGKEIKVATLGPGSCFGEEALLSGGLRNASVRMREGGRLFALRADDFNQLLAKAFVREMEPAEAKALLNTNGAVLIDCRYEDEHATWRIPGSISIPLNAIRERAAGLDQARLFLVYCRTGRRSRAAAFLLGQQGLKCSVIKGGISGWPFDCEGEPAQQLSGVPVV